MLRPSRCVQAALCLTGVLAAHCHERSRPRPAPDSGAAPAPRPRSRHAAPSPKDPVSLFDKGRERVVEAAWALQQGYAILDLSDDYVPLPFREASSGGSDFKPNDYRQRYVDLAADRVNRDGRRLKPGQHNYLELYGIPPSFSVLRARILADEANRACFTAIDFKPLSALDQSIHYVTGKGKARRFIKQAASWKGAVERELRRHGLKTIAEADAKGVAPQALRGFRLTQTRLQAIRATQARLACEGLLRSHEPLKPGAVDWFHHKAMVRFERKHMLFGWGQIWGETRLALLRSPLENNHRALLRTLRERVATDWVVIEDGSVPQSVPGAKLGGAQDRVGAFTAQVARALGVETPQKALRFLRQHPADWFEKRRIAVKRPSAPTYLRPHMDLRVVIDRGDVWYDFPYNNEGKPLSQPIARRPKLTLYVRHQEKLIPLARWGTTIGGWRTEVHGKCHYWKYKQSDVGERQWKYLVAGPVWFPPPGTPPRALVARQLRRGRVKLVTRHWEIGPGYQSAYGLVAALHTREVRRRGQLEDVDSGIRTHGSADYMSILTRHSHGCHRLHNHLAVRLFTFLLAHRKYRRLGNVPIRWRYNFTYQGQNFSFKRDHKGYYFQLEPPLPVLVGRGRVLGVAKAPITRFVRKIDENTDEKDCPAQPGQRRVTPGTPKGTPND